MPMPNAPMGQHQWDNTNMNIINCVFMLTQQAELIFAENIHHTFSCIHASKEMDEGQAMYQQVCPDPHSPGGR